MDSVYESIQRYANVPNLKEKITQLFRDLFEHYVEHPDIIRLMISEMMRSPLLMQEEMRVVYKFQDVLSSLLDNAKKKGQLSEHLASADVASVFVGVYFHSLMTWVSSERDAMDIETIFQRQFEIVWEGIRSKGDSN